jgi:hypothetical protein
MMRLLAILFAALVLAAPASAADFPLSVVSETATTITLGWDPQTGADGYRFYVNDVAVSRTFDPSRGTVRFGKVPDATYRVEALDVTGIGSGVYPRPTPPPSPVGTTIVTSGRWVCNQPLAQYGPLPIRVVQTMPSSDDALNGSVRLMDGCTGDGTPATDLILNVNGNGADIGSPNDAIVLIGAHDLEIEGYANCGRPGGGAHQDGIQMNRAQRVHFIGFEIGDWETQTATCHGAGGIFYVSELNDNAANLLDVTCDRCRMVGSTTGAVGTAFYLGASTRSGARNSCFSANRPFARDQYVVDGINDGNVFVVKGQDFSACTVG